MVRIFIIHLAITATVYCTSRQLACAWHSTEDLYAVKHGKSMIIYKIVAGN